VDNYLEEDGGWGGLIYFKEYFDSCLERREIYQYDYILITNFDALIIIYS